jgi:phosphotransferase system enzyme I (PtsP)
VVDAAGASNVPVRVCGEMGGRPLEAMALIGLGIEALSITPAGVGPIKAMVRSLDASAVRARVESLLQKPPKSMRKALSDWARRHGVTIG